MQNQTTLDDKRLTLIENLVRIGHTVEAANQLLQRAEETADILAAREESGEPSHGMDGEAEMIAAFDLRAVGRSVAPLRCGKARVRERETARARDAGRRGAAAHCQ